MRIRTRLALAVATAAAAATVSMPTSVAEAGPVVAPGPGDGSALVSITAAAAELTNGYAYNSSHGAVNAGRLDDTHFWVSWASLGGGTYVNAQLSVWNSSPSATVDPICTIDRAKDNGTDVTVWFQCTAFPPLPLAGTGVFVHVTNAPKPERFGATSPGFIALTTSDAAAASTTPANQYRSVGTSAATVARTGTGQYTVTVPAANYALLAGDVFTTALTVSPTVDPAYTRYCNPQNWYPSGSSLVVNVRCYMGAGTLADARFSLRVTRRGLNGGAQAGGTQWVSDPSSPGYDATGYGWNSAGGVNSVRIMFAWEGAGVSQVTFAGVYQPSKVPTLLVAAYGGPQRCTLKYHGGHPNLGYATATVRCFEPFTGTGNQTTKYVIGLTQY